MLPKVGKPVNEPTSYHSTSILPIASKVFKKLLLKGTKTVLPQSFLLDHQFDFRNAHSTVDQSAFGDKQFCAAAFLDISPGYSSSSFVSCLAITASSCATISQTANFSWYMEMNALLTIPSLPAFPKKVCSGRSCIPCILLMPLTPQRVQ